MYVTVQQYRGLERKPDFAGRAVNLLMTSTSGPDIAGSTSFSALIVQVGRDRDRDAFAKLFRHFAPRVKSYLIRLGAGGELAEELAQETLLTVWRRAEVYDPARAAASTWIFTIARNLRSTGRAGTIGRRPRRIPPTSAPRPRRPTRS